MDAPVVEAALDGRVDELVLLQARQTGELGSHDLGGEVIAAALVHDAAPSPRGARPRSWR